MAITDIFLKLDGIPGESADSKHKGELDILSWSFGISQPGSMATGGGGGLGKASFQDLSCMHAIDKASPNLALHCASGKHIPSATLTQRKAGEDQQEYLIIKLSDVIVSSVQLSGADGGGLPSESFSLNYAKIEMDYKPQKADGTLDAGIKFGWNLKETKKV